MTEIGNTDQIRHLKYGEVMSHLANTKLAAFRLELLINTPPDEQTKKVFDEFQKAAGVFEIEITKLFDESVLKRVRNQKG